MALQNGGSFVWASKCSSMLGISFENQDRSSVYHFDRICRENLMINIWPMSSQIPSSTHFGHFCNLISSKLHEKHIHTSKNNEQSVIQVNLYTTWFPWFSKICKCERLHLVHCLHVPRSKMSDHPFSWSIINRQKPYSPTDRSCGIVITLVFTHKNRNEIANVSQISILIMFLSMKRFDRKYLYWKVFFGVKWLHY